jgi:hypothetical protein
MYITILYIYMQDVLILFISSLAIRLFKFFYFCKTIPMNYHERTHHPRRNN